MQRIALDHAQASGFAFIHDAAPADRRFARLAFAHGAGAAMTSAFMSEAAALIAARGIDVYRFEFRYMAARRESGKKRPPPKAERLSAEFVAAVNALLEQDGEPRAPLLIGGKSMGGRVATLIAQSLFEEGHIAGAVVLGYPFHPPKKPENLRTSHLTAMTVPLLIVQGERDPFGTRGEVEGWHFGPGIRFHWADDGDHDLGPRGGRGVTRRGNLEAAADAVAAFAREQVERVRVRS